MTNEEAIRELTYAMYEVEWEYPIEVAAALELAISALEKQIPKKPKYEESGLTKYWLCPVCGEVVLAHLGGIPLENEYNHDHCGGCGQAIDWSDKDD